MRPLGIALCAASALVALFPRATIHLANGRDFVVSRGADGPFTPRAGNRAFVFADQIVVE